MTAKSLFPRFHTLPWLAALLLGGAAHVALLVQELAPHRSQEASPLMLVATAPPAVVVLQRPDCDALRAAATIPDQAVLCEGGKRCTLDRRLVHAWLSTSGHAEPARVVPSVREGKTIGLKLYGIRSGSPLRLLGFHNGDLLTAVDDRRLDSIGALYEARARLDTADDVTVHLTRRGAALTKTFQLQ